MSDFLGALRFDLWSVARFSGGDGGGGDGPGDSGGEESAAPSGEESAVSASEESPAPDTNVCEMSVQNVTIQAATAVGAGIGASIGGIAGGVIGGVVGHAAGHVMSDAVGPNSPAPDGSVAPTSQDPGMPGGP